jgi:hypothetical protein
MKYKDILIRALKTFIQGFLGALVVTLPNADITSSEVLKSLLIGAIASGISAVMNIFINAYDKTKEKENINEIEE